ncbi:MAG TPA: cytochrome P450 [Candidatus Limnocylindrales bacterium]|nr:cytochrome P450 [Candidatus Limnocylindrales bacterium]
MTAGFPRASRLESLRFTLTYLLPSMIRGIAIPLPFWTELATRFETGRGVATVERLTERYSGRPVMLRSVGGQTLLVLTAGDVRRVLESPVSVYAMNAPEKRRLFAAFAPDALNGSPPDLHAERRPFNEAVLDYGHEPHRFAERFMTVVHEEVSAMLADAAILDYEQSLAAFRRIARRCALGDAAADDTKLSEEHSRLRADADWLGLKVWNRRRNARLKASMDERIQRYVAAAEPGTLVSLFPSAPTEADTRPNGQVPFWLMALDAVRTAVFNALAVLTTDPVAHERAVAEVRAADSAHGPGTVVALADLAFVRACMLDSVRLWPAAAMLVRVTAAETEWYGETLPTGAKVLIPVVAHHRARRLPHANRFAPDLWLDGSADADWQMNVFSRGGAQCAGRNLALLLGTASLAELLRQREFELLAPKLAPDRPLPYGINPLNVRFAVRG